MYPLFLLPRNLPVSGDLFKEQFVDENNGDVKND
jgi:hypothetical protein